MNIGKARVRVGVTRSGKLIPYSPSIVDLGAIVKSFRERLFSSDDLLDAFAVFDYLAVRAIRRGEDTAVFDEYADNIRNLFDPTELDEAKNRADIRSAFDLRKLGESLVAVEFSDF